MPDDTAEAAKQLADLTLGLARAQAATMDMLGLLCAHFAAAAPTQAAAFAATLGRMRAAHDSVEVTPEFDTLAKRLEGWLSTGLDEPLLSISRRKDEEPEDVRARLHLILGGKG